MTWSERAACLGTLTEMWFPGKGNAAKNAYKAAKWYCDRCPVRRQCLEEALRTELTSCRFGMRAGLTPDERDAIDRGDVPFPGFQPPLPLGKPPAARKGAKGGAQEGMGRDLLAPFLASPGVPLVRSPAL